ncbi:hypothetical protein [Bradyrhizobium elkanii]|uniref:hypothetical protein n=1 Tax=Bradyrhizobium elkanii TaxID=29448 RepID=UPI001BA95EB1|nr:hypothetical protein [Bradyrhizobium elkanii]MBR1165252.1 hypothetical protein [Bradyrhizobium elkanii]
MTPAIQNKRLAALNRSQEFYGAPIGILLVDSAHYPINRPYIPGSVGNASTWSVPARYKTVRGLTFAHIVGSKTEDLTATVVQAAAELEREGARLITSNCGFMIRYQEAVRTAVDLPVLLSPLLLASFLLRMLPRDKILGIITASGPLLARPLLEAAGLPSNTERVAVVGLERAPSFAGSFLTHTGDLDPAAIERETIEVAVGLVNDKPNIAMLLLECSDLPAYAAAVQRAVGIPVFDFTSLVEFFVSGLTRTAFMGLD